MLAVIIAFIISHTAGISWRQYVAINLSTLKQSEKKGGVPCPKMTVPFLYLWDILKTKSEMCVSPQHTPVQTLVDPTNYILVP